MKLLCKTVVNLCLFAACAAWASVTPEYAENVYSEHNLTRSERKCLDEGYKMTYASCPNQTAPTERCPHHDTYYKSCSQEQWCRNNNFTFSDKDCKTPTFPVKLCDNSFPMYRACQENIEKACTDLGFKSKNDCQLTDKRCPYSEDFGKCCNACEGFEYDIENVPQGYVADGERCVTCEGKIKTKIVESPCENYMDCPFGPLADQTPSCLKGKQKLYSACKTADMLCKEKGFTFASCKTTEDEEACPESASLKKCRINCYKTALEMFPEADVVYENVTDPRFDLTKTSLRSLFGEISKECVSSFRPEVTLTLNTKNKSLYESLFARDITNVNFVLNFEEPLSFEVGGSYTNVKIEAKGNVPDCPFKSGTLTVNGTVSLVGFPNLCGNVVVSDTSKFITTGHVTGNVALGKDSSLGIKGNLIGSLKTKSYADVLIKGILKHADSQNRTAEDGGIVFGCNARVKIFGGIVADPSNIIIKQRSLLDTPYVKLSSYSNNADLPGTLSSVHIHRYTKLLTTYDSAEYPLIENTEQNCDDMYLVHLGSSVDEASKSLVIEPSSRQEDLWQCRTLTRQQLECN